MAATTTISGTAPAPRVPQAESKNATVNADIPADNTPPKEIPKETKYATATAFGALPKAAHTNSNAGAHGSHNAKSPADSKAPADGKAPAAPKAPADGKAPAAPKAPADGKAPAAPKAPADGKAPATPKAPADSKAPAAPKASTDGKTSVDPKASGGAGTPADGAAATPDPNGSPYTPPGSPNDKLPKSAAPTDPKTGTPEVTTVDPEVDKALHTPGANGKTVADETMAKTLADVRQHAALLKLAGAPDDAVSKYYKLKLAETMLKQGIPTGPDPKDPTVPAVPGTEGESSTYDVFDASKIEEAIKAAENDPELQAWLSKQQVFNEERILDERIKNGELADIPKDPETGLRTDYLKKKQAEFLKNPDVIKAIAKMPGDKQQEAIGQAISPFSALGATPKQSKEQLFGLVDEVTDITGAPKPVVDADFNPVKTVKGETILKDQSSGMAIAVGADGKAVADPNNGMTVAYNIDGSQTVTVNGESVQIDPSGNPIVIKDGYKNVYDRKTNDVLKNPDTGNKAVVDMTTGAVLELDAATGKYVTDPQSGMAKVVDAATGKALINPGTGNAIVVDLGTNAAVEFDKASGKIVADANGNPVIVSPKTGYQVWDKNSNPVVADKLTKLPFSTDPKSGVKTIVNPKTGLPLLDPKEGVTTILDPVSKLPIMAVTSKETGEIIKNANGQVAQIDEGSGLPVLVDPKSGDMAIVDPSNGLAVLDKKGNMLYVDKASGLAIAKDAQGKEIIEARSGAKIIYDPKTGVPIGADEAGTILVIDPKSNLPVEVNFISNGNYTKDADGNTVVMDPRTGKQMQTTDGKNIVIDKMSGSPVTNIDGKGIAVNPQTGAYLADKETGYKVMVDPKSHSMVYQDPATGNPVQDPETGGTQIADAATGMPLLDVDGNKVQIDPKTGAPSVWDAEAKTFKQTAPLPVPVTDASGNPVTTADGKIVAKDGATGNKVLLDAQTKQPIDGPVPGMPQLVDDSGVPVKDANGNLVVQDKDTGRPVAVDAYGKTIADPMGNAMVYDGQGKQVADAVGNPVVLDKASGAPIMTDKTTGEPIKDAAGNIYVANPDTGGAVEDKQTGNVVVLDAESKAPVVADANGKLQTDARGNLLLADVTTGKAKIDGYGNAIVVDKSVGVPVIVDPKTGTKTMVNGMGEPLKDAKTGAVYEVGKNGLPQLVLEDSSGNKIVIDPQTGKQMEINGGKVYIDPKTGQMVTDDPLLGNIDVVTGKAPVLPPDGGATGMSSETVDKIWKAVRAGVGATYWTTYGVVGASFSKYANDPFFQDYTKNYHGSRMTSSASGIVSTVMAAVRWSKGSALYNKLVQGDPKTVLLFAEDMSSVLKYTSFYPKTVSAAVKYLNPEPLVGKAGVQIAGDNKTIYKAGQAKGTYDVFVKAGEVNPFNGTKSTVTGWVEAPAGSFSPAKGLTNAVTAEVKPGAIRIAPPNPADPLALQFEKWNPNIAKWEPIGTNPNNLPKGQTNPNYYHPENAKVTPLTHAKFAASKLFNLISKLANFAMGVGNTVGGSLQIYKGAVQISDAINGKNAGKGVAGAFNIIGGLGYVATGVSAIAWTTGLMSAALFSSIAGVGLAIGNIATLIAIIVEVVTDPNAKKTEGQKWADKVMGELGNIDVFKPDARKKLEDWFHKFAMNYWNEKEGLPPGKPPSRADL